MSTYDDDLTAFVHCRIEKSGEAYTAANILYAASQWNAAANRLYYARFYAASDILLDRHIGAR